MDEKFGELKRLNPRTVWKSESREFTPWLAKNIQKLGDTLGKELELVETEASVGDFAVDILARDLGTGHDVIIENQFGSTDHDHLGKLMTYAAGFDVSTVVWIAETMREEHRQALDWLNRVTDTTTQFFGILIELIQVDDSRPAYNFRPVVFPNEWSKSRKPGVDKKPSAKMEAYRDYFQKMIDELREEHSFTGARVGQPQSWYGFASGYSGITYAACFSIGERVRVELYIDQGIAESNKQLFDWLYKDKTAIERELGFNLEWERLDDKRASRIAVYHKGTIEDRTEEVEEYRKWSISNLLKFKEVFDPRLEEYMR